MKPHLALALACTFALTASAQTVRRSVMTGELPTIPGQIPIWFSGLSYEVGSIVGGAGISVTYEDGNILITNTGEGGGGGGGGYATIEDEGSALTQRGTMNFTGAGVTVTDAGGKTVITIPGGGGGGGGGDMLRSVYDIDLDSIVDNSELLAGQGLSYVLNRANHTGTQAANTITGLATVATSGLYNDLSGRPTLGTSSLLDVPFSGNASSTQVVKGDDTRLTDARTPTSHTHPLSALTQSGATSGQVAAWNGSVWAPANPATGGGYTTVEDEGTPLTQRAVLNFVGAGVSVADTGGETVVTISGGGGGGSEYVSTSGDIMEGGYLHFVNDLDTPVEAPPIDGLSGAFFQNNPAYFHTYRSDPLDRNESIIISTDFDGSASGPTVFSEVGYLGITDDANPNFLIAAASGRSIEIEGANLFLNGNIVVTANNVGTAAALNVPSSGNATAGQVVKGDDTRLTDARTPTAHNHVLSAITQSGATTGQVATWNGSIWEPQTLPGGSGVPESIKVTVTQAGNGFTKDDPIVHNGTSWVKAVGNSTYAASRASHVVETTGDTFTAVAAGKLDVSGKTPGALYYMAASGGVTTTEPTSGYRLPVFQAHTATVATVVLTDPLLVDNSPISLAEGGTGRSLSDPNADRLFGWNDSSNQTDWVTIGSGLNISGGVLSASTGGYTTVQDEGTPLTARTTVNFVGSGVTAADSGGVTTVTISGGGAVTLNDLTDVTISSPSTGQVLKYNGSAWVNDTDATGGGGGTGTKTMGIWNWWNMGVPDANFATFARRNGRNVYAFDDTTAEAVILEGVVPEGFSSPLVTVRARFRFVSAVSPAVIRIGVAVEKSNGNDMDADDFESEVASSEVTANATAGIDSLVSVNLSNAQFALLTGGDEYRVRLVVKTDGYSGTKFTGDVHLTSVEIREQ